MPGMKFQRFGREQKRPVSELGAQGGTQGGSGGRLSSLGYCTSYYCMVNGSQEVEKREILIAFVLIHFQRTNLRSIGSLEHMF